MVGTMSVPGQTTFRMSPELQGRLSAFHDQHPYIPINRVLERALAYYLDAAENGIDGKLNPIKGKKV